jgi:Transcriptional regulators
MSVKLKDVAEHINVSVSTVSRVLNNKNRVAENTRKKVLSAMQDLGYVPNEVARSLKKKLTNAIGIIITDIDNNYYSKLVTGVESVAYKMGYYTIVCSSMGDAERELEYINMLFSMNVSGLIISSVLDKPTETIKKKAESIPIVFVDNIPEDIDGCSSISVDNYSEAKQIVQIIINSGHRRIAVIEGSLGESSHRDRTRGFLDTVKLNGIEGIRLHRNYASTVEGGYEATLALLKEHDVDAIFAVNNFIAYGAIKAIRDECMNVPDDISVCCFDADDETGLARLKLTCFMQPIEEMGMLAANIVLDKYTKNDSAAACESHRLSSTFVPGNSIKSTDHDTNLRHGKKIWYFTSCSLAPVRDSEPKDRASVVILNPSNEVAQVKMTLYFEDQDPVENIDFIVQPSRICCINMDDPANLCGVTVPRNVHYAIRLESSVPIISQHGAQSATT